MPPVSGQPQNERFIVFDCDGSACMGVLATPPEGAPSDIGVVIVVGGPQYRVGSHRQFVLLARALGDARIPTLRFDYRGMGDSEGEPRTFETVGRDIDAAVGTLQRESGVRRVVLWGLCDGATAALMYAADDPRISGIVCVNPWARSPSGDPVTMLKHYYLRRLLSRAFWLKTLSGKLDMRGSRDGLLGVVRSRTHDSQETEGSAYLSRLEEGWFRFDKPTLFILSGNDLTARGFEEWIAKAPERRAMLGNPRSEICRFPSADHTFTRASLGEAAAKKTIDWIARMSS